MEEVRWLWGGSGRERVREKLNQSMLTCNAFCNERKEAIWLRQPSLSVDGKHLPQPESPDVLDKDPFGHGKQIASDDRVAPAPATPATHTNTDRFRGVISPASD
jgi:hypothetical protein